MTRIIALLVACLVMGPTAIEPAAQESSCPQARNMATALGKRFDYGKPFPAGETTYEIEEKDPGLKIRYLRVRLRVDAAAGLLWHLVVRDSRGHAIQVLTEADFQKSRERWTVRIPGAMARFDRFVDGDPDGLQVRFVEYIAMDTDAKNPYYSYQDPANPKIFPLYGEGSPSSLDDRRLGDSIAFLTAADGEQVWACSGVMIAPDLLMTNWHCGGTAPMLESEYWTDAVCRGAIIDVSWDDDGRSSEFGCVGKPQTDDKLDVAIIRIQPIEGIVAIRPATLSSASPPADGVKLIHHPEGRQKRIGLNCSVKSAAIAGWRSPALVDFSHDCDSEGGSSGAPLFDKKGKVIGLHHHGFNRNPKTCQPEDRVNKAIRIEAILEWLDSSTELKAIRSQLRIR